MNKRVLPTNKRRLASPPKLDFQRAEGTHTAEVFNSKEKTIHQTAASIKPYSDQGLTFQLCDNAVGFVIKPEIHLFCKPQNRRVRHRNLCTYTNDVMQTHPAFILEAKKKWFNNFNDSSPIIKLLRVWRDHLYFSIKFDCILWRSLHPGSTKFLRSTLANVKGLRTKIF